LWTPLKTGEPSGSIATYENVLPPLAVHNNAGPKVNNRWDAEKVSPSDLEKMKPFLTKIKTLKIRGLASIGIVASFIRC